MSIERELEPDWVDDYDTDDDEIDPDQWRDEKAARQFDDWWGGRS